MFRFYYRTGPRTAVSVGPVGAAITGFALAVVFMVLAWRVAVALLVIGICYGAGRLTRRYAHGRHRRS